MKNYIILNKISNVVIWRGSIKDAQALVYNPFVTEQHMKDYANRMGSDLYCLVE